MSNDAMDEYEIARHIIASYIQERDVWKSEALAARVVFNGYGIDGTVNCFAYSEYKEARANTDAALKDET
jgi:hypothetical protein